MKTSIVADLYYRCAARLSEAPVWDAGTLYWVDITGKALFAKPDHAASAHCYELDVEVGSFALWRDTRLIAATANGFQSFDLTTGKLEPIANPEPDLPDNRFNDGKCDPRGRFVAGTINRLRLPEAALYLLDHDGSARELYRPVTNSNGLAWSKAGDEFYYIDTATSAVRAFAYDLENAHLGDERVVIRISRESGRPDGMTIDREGNLWIALWGGGAVEGWSPRSGERLARIQLPVAHVSSCIFGGENFETLFITTAREGLNESALAQQELAGSIFCARPGVGGYPAVRFESQL